MTIGTCPSCCKCKLAIFSETATQHSSTCAAFPNGIPKEILDAEIFHDKPYPGDNGIIRVPGEPTYKD